MQGSCLCGAVRYRVDPQAPVKLFQYCHCSRCQKSTGSAHGANLFVAAEHFHWLKGEELLTHFKLPDSRYFATWFCSHCGSPMPRQPEGVPNMVIPAGSLDETDGELRPQQNIYWKDRAAWYVDVPTLPCFDEYPRKG